MKTSSLTIFTYRADHGERSCRESEIRLAQTRTSVIARIADACDRSRNGSKGCRC
jgi:hypothetical protein